MIGRSKVLRAVGLCVGILIASGVAALTGCASAELTVTVDLFEVDPIELITAPEIEAAQNEELIGAIAEQSELLAEARIASIEASVNVLEASQDFLDAAIKIQGQPVVGSKSLEVLRKDSKSDAQEIRRLFGVVDQKSEEALRVLRTYTEYRIRVRAPGSRLPPSLTASLRKRFIESQQALANAAEAIGGYESDVEKYIAENRDQFEKWPEGIKVLTEKIIDINKQDELIFAYKKFTSTLNETDEAFGESVKGRRELAQSIATVPKPEGDLAPKLAEAMRLGIQALTGGFDAEARSVTNAEALSDLRERAIGFSQLNSQIDRVQDPADPMLRVISSSRFERYWNTDFARTFSRAEGNYEVVIVRDRVGHFKVKSAKNNPAALVEGQLKINRALASGVVDILAAASGVPGINPGLSKRVQNPGSPDSAQAGSGNDVLGPLEELTIAQTEAEITAGARRELLRSLQLILDGVERIDAGSPSPDELVLLKEGQLRTVELLKAFLSRFPEDPTA